MSDLNKNEYIFVEASKGQFKNDAGELINYDNVILSDGLRTLKVKRDPSLNVGGLVSGDVVHCDFSITAGKQDKVVITLSGAEKVS